VIDCQVNDIIFPLESRDGVWWFKAFVILNSADDVDKAVAKDRHCIGRNTVTGWR